METTERIIFPSYVEFLDIYQEFKYDRFQLKIDRDEAKKFRINFTMLSSVKQKTVSFGLSEEQYRTACEYLVSTLEQYLKRLSGAYSTLKNDNTNIKDTINSKGDT